MAQTMQESKKAIQEVDRISSLPDHLQHSVMFLLDKKDAARMSFLSRGWNRVWVRFPIIDIDEGTYRSRQDFIRSLQWQVQQHHFDHLQNLSLRTTKPMTGEIYQKIDDFVHKAIRGNLQNLRLNFYASRRSKKMYIVPDIVFSGDSSLTSLRVAGCDFKSYEVLNLHLLTTLKLRHIQIEEDLIQKLMQSCPLLETFYLEYYLELRSLTITHDRIRKFAVTIDEDLEEFEICLPNLESFKYKGYYSFEEGYMSAFKFETLNTVGEYALQSFYLKYAYLEAQTFESLQLKHVRKLLLHYIDVESEALCLTNLQFPCLEILSLKGCKGLEEVKVICLTMKGLFMDDCVDMKHCKMMVPNLLLFKYKGALIKMSSVYYASERLQANIVLRQPTNHRHDMLQRLRLKNFVRAFHGVNQMTIQLEENCQECTRIIQEELKPPGNCLAEMQRDFLLS